MTSTKSCESTDLPSKSTGINHRQSSPSSPPSSPSNMGPPFVLNTCIRHYSNPSFRKGTKPTTYPGYASEFPFNVSTLFIPILVPLQTLDFKKSSRKTQEQDLPGPGVVAEARTEAVVLKNGQGYGNQAEHGPVYINF